MNASNPDASKVTTVASISVHAPNCSPVVIPNTALNAVNKPLVNELPLGFTKLSVTFWNRSIPNKSQEKNANPNTIKTKSKITTIGHTDFFVFVSLGTKSPSTKLAVARCFLEYKKTFKNTIPSDTTNKMILAVTC